MAVKLTKNGLQSVPDFNPKDVFTKSPASSSSSTPAVSTPPEVIRDAETGRISGVKVGNKTYLGISAKEVENIIGKQGPQPTPAGAVEASGMAATRRAVEEGFQLAEEVGQLDPNIIGSTEVTRPDIGQAFGAGLSQGGAAAGVAAAGAVSGVITAPIAPFAAAGSFLVTALNAARGSLKSQQQGRVQIGEQALTAGVKNLKTYISLANSDPANAEMYAAEFNEQLNYIRRDYGQLGLDTEAFLSSITGVDGEPELAKYNNFFDTTEQLLRQKMQMALINPDPSRIDLNTFS